MYTLKKHKKETKYFVNYILSRKRYYDNLKFQRLFILSYKKKKICFQKLVLRKYYCIT